MLRQEMQDARHRAREYTRAHGEDLPEVANWAWTGDGIASLAQSTGDDNA
jgi:xylulose-5-phosphate/fructose-6-phosphate phosphoketolase